ncbi:MAG: MerR family transcriptional regulator, heat shock protein HspR [Gaiellales bacterium]|jgi:MerR family transcriptional regulator/heat shock protein HspR|nr:MerR family transcriptional regulator, heat shock protein HspR [Gaiellales bacterium]
MTEHTPKYMIGVAAALVSMHPQTLRLYEARGLVRPRRTPGGTRLYSDADLERLGGIQRLTSELGLSLAGVEHVLALEDAISTLARQVARLERELERAAHQHQQEVAEVKASFRRELVLWQPPSQALERQRRN